ncbi:RNA polymerase subunit sigma [Streptomyces sp. WAC 06738]|uniref:RNA polymerase sigma factor n=1 Tax=Streptomyces sp. WAC 06738 TaxID=2203210 RepID=UPI000F7095FC|nr:RNA polymerase sigma factor [Streptomyces sp. WAC 06738]AZM49728.1 RNA polymerase subunit sigma [Streptomyces sp. WAC 06738]
MESDEELLSRAAEDPEAFEPLVARHAKALHGYFARRASDAADDLLAETWLRAYSARAGFDAARGSARGWLFGVARHVLAHHWRAPGAHGSAAAQATLAGDTAIDPWHAVDQRLDAIAVAWSLRARLAALPPVERELLLLVAWEELTPVEAAAVVGIPAGTARSRLHRARARMRGTLSNSQ